MALRYRDHARNEDDDDPPPGFFIVVRGRLGGLAGRLGVLGRNSRTTMMVYWVIVSDSSGTVSPELSLDGCCMKVFFFCMCVMNHNWSATKQRPHPQSVAEISRHSVLSGDRIRQCGTSSRSRHKDTDQCL